MWRFAERRVFSFRKRQEIRNSPGGIGFYKGLCGFGVLAEGNGAETLGFAEHLGKVAEGGKAQ